MLRKEKFFYFTKKIFIIIMLFIILLYFLFHTLNGKYNLKSFIHKKDIRLSKEIELEKLNKNIINLENKIENFQKNIGDDILDEEIKKNTSYIDKDEIVIYSKDLNDKN